MTRPELPPAAWRYFDTVLGLVVTSSAAELLGHGQGHYVVDKLTPFIERTRSLVDGVSEMDSATHATLSTLLGDALTTSGEQSGNNAAIVIVSFRFDSRFVKITLKRSAVSDTVLHSQHRPQLLRSIELLRTLSIRDVALQQIASRGTAFIVFVTEQVGQ